MVGRKEKGALVWHVFKNISMGYLAAHMSARSSSGWGGERSHGGESGRGVSEEESVLA